MIQASRQRRISRCFSPLGGSDSKVTFRSRTALLRFDRRRAGPVLDSSPSDIDVMADTSNPMDENAVTKRCVILVAPNEPLPQTLVNLLGDQGSTPQEILRARHPLTATALLASLERGRRMRTEWSPGEAEQTILVVSNRNSWPDLSGLFESTRLLMPAVGIWVYTDEIVIEIEEGRSSIDPEAATDQDATGPMLESPAPPVGDRPEGPGDDREEDDPTRLTEDELQDLLDLYNDFDEDERDPSEEGPIAP